MRRSSAWSLTFCRKTTACNGFANNSDLNFWERPGKPRLTSFLVCKELGGRLQCVRSRGETCGTHRFRIGGPTHLRPVVGHGMWRDKSREGARAVYPLFIPYFATFKTRRMEPVYVGLRSRIFCRY